MGKQLRKVVSLIDFYQDKHNKNKWYFVLKGVNGRNIGRSPNYAGFSGAKEALRRLINRLHSYSFTVECGLLYCYSRSNGHILFTRYYPVKDTQRVNKITEDFMNKLNELTYATRREVYRQNGWVRYAVSIQYEEKNDDKRTC